MSSTSLQAQITQDAIQALSEDIGSGDITARLIPEDLVLNATVICREPATLCGSDWFTAVYRELDKDVRIQWTLKDGDRTIPNQIICTLEGSARSLLSGERAALNFLQTLSATATLADQYAAKIRDLDTKILDTRKTIPGLRIAQKYAVQCGGCFNHRMGLFDAFLIKENHIAAAGSITNAVRSARALRHDLPIEVEVENFDELREALKAKTDRVLLDNFTLDQLHEAVTLNNKRLELEASGNIGLHNLREVALTGVDYISIGALTKNITAIDLSMRINS